MLRSIFVALSLMVFTSSLPALAKTQSSNHLNFSGNAQLENAETFHFSGLLVLNTQKSWFNDGLYEGSAILSRSAAGHSTSEQRHATGIFTNGVLTVSIEGYPELELIANQVGRGALSGRAISSYTVEPSMGCGNRSCAASYHDHEGHFAMTVR